ncbi:MAG TPA: hypothetical protein VHM48_04085, partial [Candidatus Limnocylindrales bacterium]|nr:hypothetical protein [Candidatus Limnocylindrales bacterium]
VLVPAAVAAGAALAIGNTLVDVERDRAAAVSSIAISLGPSRASRLGAVLLAAVWVAAVGSAIATGAGWIAVAAITVAGMIPVVAAIGARAAASAARERAWQAEAIGLAVLATVWLAIVLAAGRPLG